MTLPQKIGAYITAFIAVCGFIAGVWEAAPIISELQVLYNSRESIKHVQVMVQEVHELQSKMREIEMERDSLNRKVGALLHGKFPYDSVYVLTSSGWKIYQKDTKWLYRRRE